MTYKAKVMVNYLHAMQEKNIATPNQLIEFSDTVAGRRLAENLDLEIVYPIYRVIILRFTNRVPVILERDFFSCSKCPDPEEWDLEKNLI